MLMIIMDVFLFPPVGTWNSKLQLARKTETYTIQSNRSMLITKLRRLVAYSYTTRRERRGIEAAQASLKLEVLFSENICFGKDAE